MTVVECEKLSVGYADRIVLKNIDLRIDANDFLAVIGPNGGGKSTFLKTLLGVKPPSGGTVRIFGKPPKESRRDMGYLPQQRFFDPDFPINVREVVATGIGRDGTFLGRGGQKERQAIDKALAIVGMREHADKKIGYLSEGQRQRVLLARALVGEPKMLLLDEPTCSVDAQAQESIYKLLGSLKSKVTIIMVTHDIGTISSYANKVACLSGDLYYHGTNEIRNEDLEKAYGCPVDLISHGKLPHRVMKEHGL